MGAEENGVGIRDAWIDRIQSGTDAIESEPGKQSIMSPYQRQIHRAESNQISK